MGSGQVWLWLIPAACVVAGCANNGKVHQLIIPTGIEEADRPDKPATRPATKVDAMDAAAPSPELLAKKTAAFSKQIAEQTAASAPAVPAAPPKLPINPSVVEFAPAGEAPGSAFSLQPTLHNPVKPAMELTPLPSDQAVPPSGPTDPLGLKLSQRLDANPRDVSSHLEKQLLNFLEDKPAPDPTTLAVLPADDRELISTLLDGLSNFRNGLRADSNMLMSAKVSPLLTMADRLRTESDLTVPTVELCDSVAHFGDYHPIESKFPAGKENGMVVYCEVANFMSNLNDQQRYETHMSLDVTLFSDSSQIVWSAPRANFDEQTRTQRHDYYVSPIIKLPGNLPIGRYVLKVCVTDKLSNHLCEHSKDISIGAK